MKYIKTHKVGQEEAFLGVIEREGAQSYKAGLSTYGNTTTHCSRSSGYKTLNEAEEAYEFCKGLVNNQ